MRNGDPTFSYQQGAARGASPVGQIVALYDTILRDFARALAALQAGDVETRVLEFNHALLVIAHLQNVLDFERGADAAKHLAQLYSATRAMIVQANIRPTQEAIEELINLYGGLRQAWRQVEQKSSAEPAPAQVTANNPHGSAPVTHAESDLNEDLARPHVQWSA